MLNVIIVDDEPLALDVLETYIAQMPELNLVQRCTNALEANEALKNQEVDLIFLDIQMPQLTGIDFVKALTRPPMIHHGVPELCYPGLRSECTGLPA